MLNMPRTLLLFALFFAHSPITYSSPKKDTTSFRSAIQKLFERANQHYLNKDYPKALIDYQTLLKQLQEQHPTSPQLQAKRAVVLLAIGRTFEHQNQIAHAAKAYRQGLSTTKRPKIRQALQYHLHTLIEKKGSKLSITTHPPSHIELTNEAGFRYRGKTPIELELSPAPLSLKLTQKGYRSKEAKNVPVKAGQTTKLAYTLQKLPPKKRKKKPVQRTSKTPPQKSSNTIAWVTGIIGGTALIAGSALVIYGYSSEPTGNDEVQARTAQSIRVAGFTLMGISGVIIGISAYRFISSSKSPPTKSVQTNTIPAKSHNLVFFQ